MTVTPTSGGDQSKVLVHEERVGIDSDWIEALSRRDLDVGRARPMTVTAISAHD